MMKKKKPPHIVLTTKFHRVKEFFDRWVLPPLLSDLLSKFIRLFIKKTKKEWFCEPVDTGLHPLEFFAPNRFKPYWFSLNQEARPAISFRKEVALDIEIKRSAKAFQFGVGSKDFKRIREIKFYIDEKLSGSLTGAENDIWNDFRIPLDLSAGKFTLRIESSGDGTIYLSHPIINYADYKMMGHRKKPGNIICVVLDALTPYCFEAGGVPVTPFVYDFFSDGIICDQAYAQGEWTLPAFSSILSGYYSSRHGVYHPDVCEREFPKGLKTLPELLLESGYRTFGYSNYARFGPTYGHAKGFERFIFRPFTQFDQPIHTIRHGLLETMAHLEAHQDEPNFIFLHIFETHSPYRPSTYYKNILMNPFRNHAPLEFVLKEDYETYLKYKNDARNCKLREVDLVLDCLFSYIKKRPWRDEATIVLTADHGLPYRIKGRQWLSQDRTNVPLFVKSPLLTKRGGDHSYIEASVDLMPSLLWSSGIPAPDGIDGKLWSFFGGEKRRSAFSESLYYNNYKAVIRNDDRAYFFNCRLDYRHNKVVFGADRELAVLARKMGRDVEGTDIVSSLTDIDGIYGMFENHHKAGLGRSV